MITWLLKKLIVGLKSRTIETDGRPYLTRFYVWPGKPRTNDDEDSATSKLPFAIFVHFFHRGDSDRELHNHPWKTSVSLILSGGYVEEREEGLRTLRPGMINVIRGTDFHRVELLKPDQGCWTIFIAGRKASDWGFKARGSNVFVPWREYIGAS